MNMISVSISLEPDQARHFVGPGLVPNCLQMLSADDTDRLACLHIRNPVSITHQPASETPFEWRFAGRLIVVRFYVLTGKAFECLRDGE